MSEKPDLFPSVYVGMIRAGEVGGILEETVHRLAESFEDDLEYQGNLKAEVS